MIFTQALIFLQALIFALVFFAIDFFSFHASSGTKRHPGALGNSRARAFPEHSWALDPQHYQEFKSDSVERKAMRVGVTEAPAGHSGGEEENPRKLEIERRAKLSYKEFEQTYLYPNKPVIVTDAIREWKALSYWTPEFFRRTFGEMKFTLPHQERLQPNYDGKGEVEYTMTRFIDRVLESTDEDPAPYFSNRILHDLFPSLEHDIEPLPDYFQPNWLPEHYIVGYVEKVLNRGAAIELYIGGKGGKFPVLHYDGAGTHAFLMQIYGRKKFVIYPPDQERYLYPSPQKQNFSMINNVNKPDLDRFPLFAKATPITFILEPGELLFIPSHWWHTTQMLTPSISVSINTVNQSNWHELVKFVARGRRNPFLSIASRVYLTSAGAWRSWRDRNWSKRVANHAA
jgi:Cupin-like domain